MQSTTQSSNLNTKIPKKGILKNKSLSNDLSSSDNLSKSNIQSRSSSSCSSNQLLIDDAHKYNFVFILFFLIKIKNIKF